jgi:hypothetical protein
VTTTFTITHNLNSLDVWFIVREVSTGLLVYPDVTVTSVNDVQIEFVDPPTTNQYSVRMIGT